MRARARRPIAARSFSGVSRMIDAASAALRAIPGPVPDAAGGRLA